LGTEDKAKQNHGSLIDDTVSKKPGHKQKVPTTCTPDGVICPSELEEAENNVVKVTFEVVSSVLNQIIFSCSSWEFH